MHYKLASASLMGIDAYPVDVEVDVSSGLPNYIIVGLPDPAVRESKQRVRTALKNCGYQFESRKVVINLAPADRKKEGSAFDLPIALGILAHWEIFPVDRLQGYIFLGELALDGRLKPGRGILAACVLARNMGFKGAVIPRDNEREAALIEGLDIYALGSLIQVVHWLNDPASRTPSRYDLEKLLAPPRYRHDFKEIKGQHHVKRALEVAAAGAHNVLLIGPPGAGKTMLARRIPTILPPMALEEILEVTRIYSASGFLQGEGIIGVRPFRAPHHSVSAAGLVGGGVIPRPGNVSLAHCGVLFLDELTEFRKHALESLRQPLEDGCVTISRAANTVTFPSRFMLIAAMNPAEFSDSQATARARGDDASPRRRLYGKLSAPLLDRIDIQIEVPRVEFRDIVTAEAGESSRIVRKRVTAARKRQWQRFRGASYTCNAQMGDREISRFCRVDFAGERLLEMTIDRLGFSVRGYTRVLKMARTIADLAGEKGISASHISEAIQYRTLDRYQIPG